MAEPEYERSDVNVRAVVKAGLVVAGLSAFGAAASFGVFLLLKQMDRRHERPLPPLAQEPGRRPPEPRLQTAPQADLEQLRAQEGQRLSSYGWVDPQAGIVRIPIEEAMKLYAQRAAARPLTPVPAPAILPAPAVPSPSASPARPRFRP